MVRGKILADKSKIQGLDLGKNYLNIGKGGRGITSQKDVDIIKGNIKEVGDYTKEFLKAVL